MSLEWPDEPPVLDDGDVALRPWRAGDEDAVYRACQDEAIQRWTRVPVPYRRTDAQAFVTQLAPQAWRDRDGAAFAVVDPASGELLASVGLVAVDAQNGGAEIGYWVAPWARGRRVAAAAVERLSLWAFAQVGFGRLELLIDPRNAASRRVAEKAGFAFEGVLRGKLLLRGERRDAAVYGRLG